MTKNNVRCGVLLLPFVRGADRTWQRNGGGDDTEVPPQLANRDSGVSGAFVYCCLCELVNALQDGLVPLPGSPFVSLSTGGRVPSADEYHLSSFQRPQDHPQVSLFLSLFSGYFML